MSSQVGDYSDQENERVELLAGIQRVKEGLAEERITVKLVSPDIAVTVNGHGELILVDISRDSIRTCRSSVLGQKICDVINQARNDATKLSEERLAKLFPEGYAWD